MNVLFITTAIFVTLDVEKVFDGIKKGTLFFYHILLHLALGIHLVTQWESVHLTSATAITKGDTIHNKKQVKLLPNIAIYHRTQQHLYLKICYSI